MRNPVLVVAVGATLVAAEGASAIASGITRVGPSTAVTGNGRHLTPAGRMTRVGDFPSGSALTPDGRFLWAVDSGHGKDDVQVVDISSGKVTQVLPLPGAYGAVTFNPAGTRAYVSGEPIGDSKPTGKTVGNKGDVIHVFAIDASGHATERGPIALPATTGGTAQQEAGNPASAIIKTPGPGPSSGLGWPIGLAVTPNGKTLVVALNQADQVAIIDLKTNVSRLVKVGRYPYGVATSASTAYVTNEYDGTVSAIDLASANVVKTARVGVQNSHPEDIKLVRDNLYIAVTNEDKVVRMHTGDYWISATYDVSRAPAVGTAPVAITVSKGRIYVADAGEDAVAVIDQTKGKVVGRIPTAAYTSGVSITGDNKLVWTAAKGLGAGPNPGYGKHFANSDAAPYGTYVPDMLLGRVGVLDVPNDKQLAKLTAAANKQVTPADFTPPPTDTVVTSPGGGASAQIKHVFYVVRENRTYDQIFGSLPRGDGDPKLELFDDNGINGPAGGVTPNAHALVRRFPLLDNFYADSEVSVDGHLITSGGYATDFVQRALHPNYSNRGRSVNFGEDPVTLPPNDFIFDQAVRQNISFNNYGEMNAGIVPAANDNRPTYAPSLAQFKLGYPLFFGCDGIGTTPNGTDNALVCDTDSGTLGAGANVATSRFDFFQAAFTAEVASGTVPALTYLTLPNDHTNGVKKNYPTPSAMVADNDLALGQLVDLVSHSSIWGTSAIIVVEDDSQDGADHVDAHRMPAFVISPWAKEHTVLSTRYDQVSALRTVEMMVGLKPLALPDGLAEPMYDAFIPPSAKPDLTPYNAVTPKQPLTELSARNAPGLEGELPYDQPDLVPQSLFDAALWHSVYGQNSTPPPPGPNASPVEEARAQGVKAAYARGLNPTTWLMLEEYADRD